MTAVANKNLSQQNQHSSSISLSPKSPPPCPSLLQVISDSLTQIVNKNALAPTVKDSLEELARLTAKAEEGEQMRQQEYAGTKKLSELHKEVQDDLVQIHDSIVGQITTHLNVHFESFQKISNNILKGNDKLLKEAEKANTGIKEVTNKVTVVTDTMDKIATEAKTYCDVLLTKPAQTNRAEADPKVLSDLDRRGKQILVNVYGEEGDIMLSKSPATIVDKANEAIDTLNDAAKPAGIRVVTAFKTRGKAILLTLNSKESANWFSNSDIKTDFSNAFSKDAHIKPRLYNLILPGIPITLDLDNKTHLREVEEVNNLEKNSIYKAR
ncbi:hypothetical protein BC827DRAFT_1268093 [Russula dissimulans]|nr:hypothetical protein BC827DRAFT_1268093 [Russula dissimulans]